MKFALWLGSLTLAAIVATTPPVIKTSAQLQKVHSLPPIYVSIPEIPDCDPKKNFPQMILLPQYSKASQVVSSCEFYDRDNVAWSMNVFYTHWKGRFGDRNRRVHNMLNSLMVTWGEKEKTVAKAYSIDGYMVFDVQVVGLALAPSYIWVHVGDTGNISDTALVHELVHLALWVTGGDPDADHEGRKHRGWSEKHTEFIFEANSLLKSYNL